MPELLPIAHDQYRTKHAGRYADGQFFAAVHGAHRDDDYAPDPGRQRVRWYAYLHLFDRQGRHRHSRISFLGVAPYLREEMFQDAQAHVAGLLDGLPEREERDIRVQLFQLVHDGVTFGLVDESDEERGDWVEMYPDRLGFCEPWEGSYST